MTPARPLVLGLGSDHGDDLAGWLVVAGLHARGWDCGEARRVRHPAEIVDWCDPARPLVLCDACAGSGPPGFRRRWVWPADRWPGRPAAGTHDLPATAALELGRTLGRLPPEVIVWTIEGRTWSPGGPADPAVAAAAGDLAAALDEAHRVDGEHRHA